MSRLRAHFIFLLLVLATAAVISRLFWLQLAQYDFYKAMAQGQQRFSSEVPAERGEIFFRGGERLAINQRFGFVAVRPEAVNRDAIAVLSRVLELEPATIEKKLNSQNTYEVLKNKLLPEQVERLSRLGIESLEIGEEILRFYPQRTLASQTIGFVSADKQGQYGLEGFYQNTLQGKAGSIEGEQGLNLTIFSFFKEKAEKGSDLTLTLDYQIQFMAEKLLAENQEKLGFEGATIIVVDPATGEILALANWPNFDPNAYEKEKDAAIFQNSASQKIFEPGSVFKPLTMASALQEDKIAPETAYTDEGAVKIGQIPIYNYDRRQYGKQTMTQVLEKSINTGAVWTYQQLGSTFFLKYLNKFGFFEKTGVDLQAEVFSQNQEFKRGYEINFATASFGQGIEITPMQLVRAFCAIANNGKMPQLHLVNKLTAADGTAQEAKPDFSKPVISAKTSSQVVAMMTSVVENGFGKRAKVPGYYIAGKTGTAQVSWGALGVDRPGYSDETIQSFIGFAPAFNPRFLILVKLDNPRAKTAEYSAVPIFHDLAKYIIDLWQIPPDYEP